MKIIHLPLSLILVLLLSIASYKGYTQAKKQQHPNLIVTSKGMQLIKNNLGKYPLIDKSIEEIRALVDQELLQEMEIPVPIDPAGGFTHKKHKSNYWTIYRAGLVYQIPGAKKICGLCTKNAAYLCQHVPNLRTAPCTKILLSWKVILASVE